jgi:hypothetical protein
MLMQPVPADKVVDHFNRNRLDCRIENLRIVSQSANIANSARQKSASGVNGVTKQNANWTAKWIDDDIVFSRSFSIAKYGNGQALQLATDARAKAIAHIPAYQEALVPPTGYDPAKHALHPMYFDAAFEIDPTAPIIYIPRQ